MAIALQAALVLIMLPTLAFDALLTYIGFTLAVSAAITVAGVFIIRHRLPNKARRGYPVLPLLFIGISAWVAVQAIWLRPAESLVGLATIAIALLLYAVIRRSAVAC
jgi:APA family basic amino acid/polyamine antiporter